MISVVLLGKSKNSCLDEMAASLCDGHLLELANTINQHFQSVSGDLPPIQVTHSHDPNTIPDQYIIYPTAIEKQLCNIKPHKAVGTDGLPNWLLRDFCNTLSGPIAAIVNSTIRERFAPSRRNSRCVFNPKSEPTTIG